MTTEQELDVARDELSLATQLLTKSLDNSGSSFDATEDELRAIRVNRARRVLDAANRLYNVVLGRRTR